MRSARRWRRRGRRAWVRVRHAPAVFWTMTALLAALTGRAVLAATRPPTAHAPDVRAVLVTTRAVPAGRVLRAADLEERRLPARAVPPAALQRLADAVGRAARVDLVAGEAVVAARLASPGRAGTGALISPGYRGMAIQADRATPPLRVGDRVDLIATFPEDVDDGSGGGPAAGPAALPTVTVAADVAVVEASRERVTVAVPQRDANAVAYALANARVTIALTAA